MKSGVRVKSAIEQMRRRRQFSSLKLMRQELSFLSSPKTLPKTFSVNSNYTTANRGRGSSH